MKNHGNGQDDDEKAATALIMLAMKIAVGIAIIIGIASWFVKQDRKSYSLLCKRRGVTTVIFLF